MEKQIKADYFNDELIDKAVVFQPGEGEAIRMGGFACTFKVTSELSNNQLGLYEITLPPLTIGANLHYHRFMDETFIVNKGTLTISVADRQVEVKEGGVAYIPRFTPHGFRNDSNEEVTLTLIFNPSMNREGFFYGLFETLSEQPVDPEKYLKLYNKYDSFPVDKSDMLPIRK
ncbi:mannose-6-phosphate isomerase-like protein (cupin superfamily) [Chitinophaga niastensis]|uniref:Mannose-6-phosphate isomerase-like protein (Cupin superfamily) n=1 Tax=Chitinophaga niastensis TaxID=536980 RepID=A0A2P8HJD6_CHINA|nr:cupin domain-containing protein [Chitinophaga niastensis]PSL46290.1 mannose-6-phosphate isomerase-like protein (cupin superfamily) [Chitinophaga niastensis]